jgi:hypothetical protein
MTCRIRTCRHEFCWLCMNPWREHTAMSCAQRVAQAKLTGQQQTRIKDERLVERLHHYNQRFIQFSERLEPASTVSFVFSLESLWKFGSSEDFWS